ncbi:MAG: hypothetical protein P0111_18255 [Nitrospira sp.]|nr:hypothetical protein [Nitrospira sp.]
MSRAISGLFVALTLFCALLFNLWKASDHRSFNSNHLQWHVVAKSDLPSGLRLDQEHVHLTLDYLPERIPTFFPTVSSVLGRYTIQSIGKDKPISTNNSITKPFAPPTSGLVLVPVSVRIDYAEGLELGMRIGFAKPDKSLSAGTEVRNQPSKGSTKSKPNQDNKNGNKSASNPGTEQNPQPIESNLGNPQSIDTTLKAILPSQDKKSVILVVEVSETSRQRVRELAQDGLVPFLLGR